MKLTLRRSLTTQEKDHNKPQQSEMPFAIVDGEQITELPKDLYIPPVALQVFLDAFEGPLDLLLYLIRKQNLDILDIPIADITQQYVDYINLMITKEPLSVKERMIKILEKIENEDFVRFEDLFDLKEQKIGLVVTFLAILELMKELLIEIVQAEEFGTIHVKTLIEK